MNFNLKLSITTLSRSFLVVRSLFPNIDYDTIQIYYVRKFQGKSSNFSIFLSRHLYFWNYFNFFGFYTDFTRTTNIPRRILVSWIGWLWHAGSLKSVQCGAYIIFMKLHPIVTCTELNNSIWGNIYHYRLHWMVLLKR